MNPTRKFLLAAAPLACATFASSAVAQDRQAFTGPYFSVFAGSAHPDSGDGTLQFDTDLDGEFDDTVVTATGADAFSPGFCGGPPTGSTFGCTNDDEKNWTYGARVGLDGRPGGGMFLAGLLLEGSRIDLSETVSGFSTTPASYAITRDMTYAISARGRLGVVAGESALFYATGGVSYAKIKQRFATSNTANSFDELNDDEMVLGFQGGGGVEVAVTPRVRIGLEYLYSAYEDDDYKVSVGPGTAPATNPFLLANPAGTDLRASNDEFSTHSLRVTAGFSF